MIINTGSLNWQTIGTHQHNNQYWELELTDDWNTPTWLSILGAGTDRRLEHTNTIINTDSWNWQTIGTHLHNYQYWELELTDDCNKPTWLSILRAGTDRRLEHTYTIINTESRNWQTIVTHLHNYQYWELELTDDCNKPTQLSILGAGTDRRLEHTYTIINTGSRNWQTIGTHLHNYQYWELELTDDCNKPTQLSILRAGTDRRLEHTYTIINTESRNWQTIGTHQHNNQYWELELTDDWNTPTWLSILGAGTDRRLEHTNTIINTGSRNWQTIGTHLHNYQYWEQELTDDWNTPTQLSILRAGTDRRLEHTNTIINTESWNWQTIVTHLHNYQYWELELTEDWNTPTQLSILGAGTYRRLEHTYTIINTESRNWQTIGTHQHNNQYWELELTDDCNTPTQLSILGAGTGRRLEHTNTIINTESWNWQTIGTHLHDYQYWELELTDDWNTPTQ